MEINSDRRGLALPALRTVRERLGLSQQELATQAAMTRTAVANLERGASRARPSSAYRLAEALGVSVDVLAGRTPILTSPSADEAQEGVLSAYFTAAMRHVVYHRAGEQQRIYATIPGIAGLWARGRTREEAARDLREALEWWVLTSLFEHRPLPAFGAASLEIAEESAAGRRIVYPAARPGDSEIDAFGPDTESR